MSDAYRYCVHCGADCHADEPDHAADCPFLTGVWPVRVEKHCESCSCDPAILCCDCGARLGVGDFYMLREVEAGDPFRGGFEHAAVSEVICIGCKAHDDGAGGGAA